MKQTTQLYITLLALFILSACKVYQTPVAPVAAVPVNFRNDVAVDTASVGDVPWKQFFTETSLRDLIDSAIRNNFDMQVALKHIEAAQLIVQQSKLLYWPEARLLVTASTSRPSDNSLNGLSIGQFLGKQHLEDYNAGIAISWEADIWGKIKNQKAAALAAYLQTSEAKNAIQTNLVAGIAQAYYNLLMLDEQLVITKKNLLLNDSTLRVIKLQYQSGEVTQLAVQQAEVQRLAAAQLVPALEQEIVLGENAISILSGVVPGAIRRQSHLNELPIPEYHAGIPAAMVSRRPDVRSQELAVDIANARTGIAKANMYPSLSITATGGLNSFKASNWFNIPASLFGTVVGNLTQPLFNKKQLRTQYEVAKVQREQSVLLFRQSVLIAVGEVSDALVKMEKLNDQQSIAATRVNKLQQAIVNADLLFANGMANYLEVITAQSNVLSGELELASIKRARLSAVVDLYRSVGGGWQ